MKKVKKISWLALGALVASGAAVFLMIFAISATVGDIKDTAISKTPTAILANSGISEDKTLSVPVTYFDQRGDECVDLYNMELSDALDARQFEWAKCGYYSGEIEEGLVGFELGNDYLPVGVEGSSLPNRAMNDLSRWFSEVDGKSRSYAGMLKMNYQSAGAVFSFYDSEFYPLDEASFSENDFMNDDGHNHLFTMNFAVPFTPLLSGDETFEITVDDDTFVYVGNELVLDMGGVHDAVTGRLQINKLGEVYSSVDEMELTFSGVKIENNDGSIIRVFHADRDSSSSVLNMKFAGMKLNITESKLASGDGAQVAYDPSNPSYVAPLGESAVFQPDQTNGLLVLATVEAFAIVALSILLMVVIRYYVKRSVKK